MTPWAGLGKVGERVRRRPKAQPPQHLVVGLGRIVAPPRATSHQRGLLVLGALIVGRHAAPGQGLYPMEQLAHDLQLDLLLRRIVQRCGWRCLWLALLLTNQRQPMMQAKQAVQHCCSRQASSAAPQASRSAQSWQGQATMLAKESAQHCCSRCFEYSPVVQLQAVHLL